MEFMILNFESHTNIFAVIFTCMWIIFYKIFAQWIKLINALLDIVHFLSKNISIQIKQTIFRNYIFINFTLKCLLLLFQTVLNALASDDVHLYSRIAIRKNEIASNRYAAKWFNGFTLEANSLNDFEEQCDIFDWPELLTSENELIDFLYDKVSEKFVNDAK